MPAPGNQNAEALLWWKVAMHLDEAVLALPNAIAQGLDDQSGPILLQDKLREAQAILLEIFRAKRLLPDQVAAAPAGPAARPSPPMPPMPPPPPPVAPPPVAAPQAEASSSAEAAPTWGQNNGLFSFDGTVVVEESPAIEALHASSGTNGTLPLETVAPPAPSIESESESEA